jgi:hypothetical protein
VIALLGAAIVAAAVLLSGTQDSDSDPTVTAANAELSFGQSWAQDLGGGRPIGGLALEDRAALTYSPLSGAGMLLAGRVSSPGPGADPVPPALRARFTDAAQGPTTVKLGSLEAISYDSPLKGSGPSGQPQLRLFMVPSTEGYLGIACEAPVADFNGFASSCDDVASTVELTMGEALPVGPSEEYAQGLNAALRSLNEQRSRDEEALGDADTSAAQAEAATELSADHEAAAKAVAGLEPGPQDQAANAALVEALETLGAGFAALSRAANDESSSAYSAAQGQIQSGERMLANALEQIRRNGYKVGG